MCMTPRLIKAKGEYFPCGRCPECRARRISAWSFRLMQEDKKSNTSNFITLTYDTKNVPISPNGFMEIKKRDLQLFFKRLRKLHVSRIHKSKGNIENLGRIKYYAVGEYGGKSWRPHYHIILFNAKLELIQAAWKKGSVHYGKVSGASVGYTMKYISKKSRIPQHKNDDRTPEFSLMSKGLGMCYLENEKMLEWHLEDLLNRMYLNIDDGKKISMPRYYKDKIYFDEERRLIANHQAKEICRKALERLDKMNVQDKRNLEESIKSEFAKMNFNHNSKI